MPILTSDQGKRSLTGMEDSEGMAKKAGASAPAAEVLRQQSDLISAAYAAVGDEIELLRAHARAAGVQLEHDAE